MSLRQRLAKQGNLMITPVDQNMSMKKSLTSQTSLSKETSSRGKQSVNQTIDSQHRKMRSSHIKDQIARKTLNQPKEDLFTTALVHDPPEEASAVTER